MTGTTLPVTWKSSNTKIATVTSKGVVKAVANGSATITATVGGKAYKCTVKVETPKISTSSAKLTVGDKLTLKITGSTQSVTWKTSDNYYATVNSNGVVTAKSKGSATITATVGGVKYTCKVTIIDKDETTYNETLLDAKDITIVLKTATESYLEFKITNKYKEAIHMYWDYLVINGTLYYDGDVDGLDYEIIHKGETKTIKFYVSRGSSTINSLSGQFYATEASTCDCIRSLYFNYNNSVIKKYYNRNILKTYDTVVYSDEYISIKVIGAVKEGLLLSVTNKTNYDYSLYYESMKINGNKLNPNTDIYQSHIAAKTTTTLIVTTTADCTDINKLSGEFELCRFPGGDIDAYPYFSNKAIK